MFSKFDLEELVSSIERFNSSARDRKSDVLNVLENLEIMLNNSGDSRIRQSAMKVDDMRVFVKNSWKKPLSEEEEEE